MNESKITTRYAKGLFKVAQEQNILERIDKDLSLVAQTLNLPEFESFLNSPVIPVSQKQQVVAGLFKDKIHQYTLNFLLLIIENRREHFLDLIIRDFHKLYKQALNITEVELTTAVELDPQLKQEFIKILSKVTRSNVELDHKVDEQIIGGFIIRIEDKQLDASIASQLSKLKKHITNN